MVEPGQLKMPADGEGVSFIDAESKAGGEDQPDEQTRKNDISRPVTPGCGCHG